MLVCIARSCLGTSDGNLPWDYTIWADDRIERNQNSMPDVSPVDTDSIAPQFSAISANFILFLTSRLHDHIKQCLKCSQKASIVKNS